MRSKIKLLFTFLLLSIVVIFIRNGLTNATNTDNPMLVIAYSSNIEGYIEPCG